MSLHLSASSHVAAATRCSRPHRVTHSHVSPPLHKHHGPAVSTKTPQLQGRSIKVRHYSTELKIPHPSSNNCEPCWQKTLEKGMVPDATKDFRDGLIKAVMKRNLPCFCKIDYAEIEKYTPRKESLARLADECPLQITYEHVKELQVDTNEPQVLQYDRLKNDEEVVLFWRYTQQQWPNINFPKNIAEHRRSLEAMYSKVGC